MEMPAAEQPQHSPSPERSDWGRALALVVIVALCAGFVSGSCTGLVTWDEAARAVAGYLAAASLARVPFYWARRGGRGRSHGRRGVARAAVPAPAGALSELRSHIRHSHCHLRSCRRMGFYANANGLVMTENRLTEPG